MREIELSQEKVALVDDEDYEWLSQWKWHASFDPTTQGFYARRQDRRYWLHTAIWEHYNGPIPEGRTTDHIDNNGLNSQKLNLRLATPSQQNQNRRRQVNNKTGYIGVSENLSGKKYRARITVEKHRIDLGSYNDIEEAIRVRDQAVRQYFGDFAVLHRPLE